VSKSYQQSIVADQVLEGACIGNWCSLVGNLDMLFLFTQWQHRTGGGQACPLKIVYVGVGDAGDGVILPSSKNAFLRMGQLLR